MKWGTTYTAHLTVEFEDVDSQAVVHHPNYLKYCERARGRALEEEGYPLSQIHDSGYSFVIAEVTSKYNTPLRLEQKFCVCSRIVAVAGASFRLLQVIYDASRLPDNLCDTDVDDWPSPLYQAEIVLVHVDLQKGRACPFHDRLKSTMGVHLIARQDPARRGVRHV